MTAEFAAALPAVIVGLGLCIAGVQAAAQQAVLTDRAAVMARLLGRGDVPPDPPGGQTSATEREKGMVCVRMSAPVAAIGLGSLGLAVSARACALDESAVEGP